MNVCSVSCERQELLCDRRRLGSWEGLWCRKCTGVGHVGSASGGDGWDRAAPVVSGQVRPERLTKRHGTSPKNALGAKNVGRIQFSDIRPRRSGRSFPAPPHACGVASVSREGCSPPGAPVPKIGSAGVPGPHRRRYSPAHRLPCILSVSPLRAAGRAFMSLLSPLGHASDPAEAKLPVQSGTIACHLHRTDVAHADGIDERPGIGGG